VQANNISAAQIRDDYERRRREASQADATAAAAGAANSHAVADNDDDDEADEAVAAAVAADVADEAEQQEKSRKRKRNEKEAIEKIKKAKASSSKKGKTKPKGKKKKDSDDEDEDLNSDDDYDDGIAREMYKKARPAPGQFEHCELCNKRFTVTPYSKEGPDNGLLCTPCGKVQTKDLKQEKARATAKPAGKKRRKLESDRLDGIAAGGSKSLQQLCIAKVAEHHEDVEELGELPQGVLEKLGEIFSKKRVMKPRTLPLFLRPDLDSVVVHDAAYLEVENYNQIVRVKLILPITPDR
jgi:DNA repair protein RAD7